MAKAAEPIGFVAFFAAPQEAKNDLTRVDR